MPKELCGHVVGAAKKNSVDRGICTRHSGHHGRHGNKTCALCGGKSARHRTYCRDCRKQAAEGYRGAAAKFVKEIAAENQELKAIESQAVEMIAQMTAIPVEINGLL